MLRYACNIAGHFGRVSRKSSVRTVKRSHTRTFAALVAALGLALPAYAACPGGGGESLPADPAEQAALAERLAELAAPCANDSGYLAWYGALLNLLGRPAEAALLLERALLLNPEHAGAQADYADALAALGDRRAARVVFDTLLKRPDLPAHLDEPFRQRLLRLAEPVFQPWSSGGSLTLRWGRETNLNSATSRATLDLTLPEGNAELPIADGYRARAGNAMLMEAAGQAARDLPGGGKLRVFGEIKARAAHAIHDTDYRQADALAQAAIPLADTFNWIAPAKKTELLLEAGASLLDYGGEQLYQALRGGLAGQWSAAPCLTRLGIELEARRFPVNRLLDGRYGGLAGGLRCPLGSGAASLTLRGSRDNATDDRPGGDQTRADLRLAIAHPLGRGALTGEILHSRQNDRESYSSLLENGALRRIARTALKLEYMHPLASRWEALATAEISRQRSNLTLFDISNRALWLGLRWHFAD